MVKKSFLIQSYSVNLIVAAEQLTWFEGEDHECAENRKERQRKKLDIENGTFIRSKEIWEEYLRSLSKREGIVDEKTMGINKKRKE